GQTNIRTIEVFRPGLSEGIVGHNIFIADRKAIDAFTATQAQEEHIIAHNFQCCASNRRFAAGVIGVVDSFVDQDSRLKRRIYGNVKGNAHFLQPDVIQTEDEPIGRCEVVERELSTETPIVILNTDGAKRIAYVDIVEGEVSVVYPRRCHTVVPREYLEVQCLGFVAIDLDVVELHHPEEAGN